MLPVPGPTSSTTSVGERAAYGTLYNMYNVLCNLPQPLHLKYGQFDNKDTYAWSLWFILIIRNQGTFLIRALLHGNMYG